MLYLDTSVLVAMCAREIKTEDVVRWYADRADELVSAAWCVTEFASALGLKNRTDQLTADQANAAWVEFERLCADGLQLLPVDAAAFHKAAMLTMDPATGLRAGDALYLVSAIGAGVHGLVTLDVVVAKTRSG